MAPTPTTVSFVLLSAFTSNPESGNPAAVVFLPSSCLPCPNATYPNEKLQAIAKNLNQPMTAFVSPLPDSNVAINAASGGVEADFAIRWFTVQTEVQLCGHATLAAAKAIFADPHLSPYVDGKITNSTVGERARINGSSGGGILNFMTAAGSIVSAQKHSISAEGSDIEYIQMSFPHAPPTPILLTSPAAGKVREALSKALQKPTEEINLKFMGKGEGVIDDYLLVELGEDERLEGRPVIMDALKDTGYMVNILTTVVSSPTSFKETFVSRMFAPLAGVPEDQVCGSAHCLLTPYWAQKRASLSPSVSVDTPMQALQVSPRGGLLRVSWIPPMGTEAGGFVKIGGEVVAWGRGEVYI